jgi:hypothetical protein
MNILIIGRTYKEHIRYTETLPISFISQYGVVNGSKVILYDASNKERLSNVAKTSNIEYHDVIGFFEEIHITLKASLGNNKLDFVFIDHSTLKFTQPSVSTNPFHMLFKNGYIKDSTIFHIRNLRPKNLKIPQDEFKFKPEYLESYKKKINNGAQKKFNSIINNGKTKVSVIINNDLDVNELKSVLHKEHKISKTELYKMMYAGKILENTFKLKNMYSLTDGVQFHLVQTMNTINSANIKKLSNWLHKLFEKNGFVCEIAKKEDVLYNPHANSLIIGDHTCVFHKQTKIKKKPNVKNNLGGTCVNNSDCKNDNCIIEKCTRKSKK